MCNGGANSGGNPSKQQEFVIGGYGPPAGSRMYFGSLLVGYYGPDGLLFAGRVGTGLIGILAIVAAFTNP